MKQLAVAACMLLPLSGRTLPAGPPEPTLVPLVRVVDLNVGQSKEVRLCDGKRASVRLLELKEIRDDVRSAVRQARVKVEVNGRPVTLTSGTYHLPITIAGVRIDCPVTKGYLKNSSADRWGLAGDVRLRLWPAGSSLLTPGTFVYPVKQRWFASLTWMANEPVDGGKQIPKSIYYHSGLDFGGSEGLDQVVSATDGLVVLRGTDVLPGYDDTPVSGSRPRADVVYVVDPRGWFYHYTHLQSIDPGVRLGQTIKMGQKIGILGKEGSSGGWSHLHFEIKSRQPSGKWGTQASYAFCMEAYRNQYSPKLLAVARPWHLARVGSEVTLDATRSWSATKIVRYEWTFSDGTTASSAKVKRTYDRPGTYSDILKITDSQGRIDYDFSRVVVVEKSNPKRFPPYIHAAYHPTFGIKPGDRVTFKVRSFYVTTGHETWDFGDGSPPVQVKSDGNVDRHAKDGYAVVEHRYGKPGHYLVSVERIDPHGHKAMTHLHVRVEPGAE